jgi:hypothetical protein
MTEISGVKPASRPLLDRWLALLVRYWAYNMSLVHARNNEWPGFGYTADEKTKLAAIAGPVPGTEYALWLAVGVVIFIAILGAVVVTGMNLLTVAIGGEQNMAQTPASLFFLQLGLDLVFGFSLGFPAAMLPAAALAGWWSKVTDADLPDRMDTAHFFHKLWFQITRMALLLVCALLPLWIFVPGDSKMFVIAKLVLPLLSPAVAALTAGYYFTARLRRSAPGT